MAVEPPSIIVLQIVLSFVSRSILATQTNLSLVLKKWYLHAGVWFTSNCHKTQPTNDFQEKMVVEPPFNYCASNFTKFLFKIHLSHSNQSWPYPQEMVFTCWSLIPLKLLKNSTHQWLSRINGCGTPFNCCPPNCTKFLFKIHLSHSNQS